MKNGNIILYFKGNSFISLKLYKKNQTKKNRLL